MLLLRKSFARRWQGDACPGVIRRSKLVCLVTETGFLAPQKLSSRRFQKGDPPQDIVQLNIKCTAKMTFAVNPQT
jgi:hypothetical protein